MKTLRCSTCKDIIGFADERHAIDQFITLLCQPCARKADNAIDKVEQK